MIGSQTNSRYKADFVLDITFQTKNQDNKKFWIAYKLRYKKRPILSSLPLPNEYRTIKIIRISIKLRITNSRQIFHFPKINAETLHKS
jgi:hypothetical protein